MPIAHCLVYLIMNPEQLYRLYLQYPSVKTDTRQLQPGDLFFALRGPSFNGNAFAQQALKSGAAFAIIDDPQYTLDNRTIVVEDVLTSLQQLARYHRRKFTIPFLAITGSNGKTTTKELIHQVLSGAYKAYTTPGNLNNHIGIPLTILSIRPDAGIAVIEMGANHLKEIADYCTYALPTHGIITNCGKAHLEGFGSLEGVRKGKGELYDFLREESGTAFVMSDYDYLKQMSTGIPEIVTYGTMQGNITGSVSASNPYLEVNITKGADIGLIKTQLVGEYNLPNVLVAVAVGKYFNVPDQVIKASIEAYAPSNSRSQLIQKGSNQIILDAYNANPSSMKSAIENFAHLKGYDKILMLGAMAELGKDSLQEHQSLIQLIKEFTWKQVVLVGGDFLKISHPYLSFPDAALAGDWYRQQHFKNTQFLIKGSRSMQMEKIVDEI